MKRDAGFILVNALLIVAALTTAALVLLARAESGRTRLAVAQEAQQAGLYLDGVEALAITVLNRDVATGPADHLREAWAGTAFNVPVDRGRVQAEITDLQGLFNVNWVLDPTLPGMEAAFEEVCRDAGLSRVQISAILAYLKARPANPPSAYARSPVPIRPQGEPVEMIEELRQVAGLSEAAFRRLRSRVTALPSELPLNVNTAPEEVIEALLPESLKDAAKELVSERRLEPFKAPDEFLDVLLIGRDVEPDAFGEALFSVESSWFLVESAASLGETTLHRRTVIERSGPARRARVANRVRTGD